jgi:hypothetical protein
MRGANAALAFALACAAAGCAKDPTELLITVSLDGTSARPITSLDVTLDAPGGRVARRFASVGAVPDDADVASFAFPAYLDYLISNDATAISGAVTVTVEARDPLTADTLLAHGMGMATVVRNKTTATTVALTLDAPPVTEPDGGVSDGAGADGLPTDDAAADDAGTDAAPTGP